MADAGDHDSREAVDHEFLFRQWVRDPEGRMFRVEGITTSGASGPVFLAAPGHRLIQTLLSVVNKGLVRVQQPTRRHERFDIEICQVDERREQLVSKESFDAVAEGRRRARALVSQIEDGTFGP